MRLAFTADEGGFDADKHALVCGVAGESHYLTFQRDAEGASEDWGIPLEYDDQINGDYGCVAACRISPVSLSVDLASPLGKRIGDVTGFDVTLRLPPDQLEAVRAGLRRVFRGHLDLLAEV